MEFRSGGGKFGRELYGDRPVVIMSPSQIIERYGVACIVPLSTTLRDGNTHSIVKSCKYPSIAMCEQVKTVDVTRLTKKYGSVTDIELKNIEDSLKAAIGIDSQYINMEKELKSDSEKLKECEQELSIYKRMYNHLLEKAISK